MRTASSDPALRHTLKIFAFLFVVTFVLNLLVEAVGPETLGAFVLNRPVIGELLGGIIGFIPNCAASVVLTTLYLEGAMSGAARCSRAFLSARASGFSCCCA